MGTRTSLEIYEENLTNELYQSIFENHTDEIREAFDGKKLYFQHDNHSTYENMAVLDDYDNIDQVDFPTSFLHLNLIQNMWSTPKYRVAYDAPKTKKALIGSLHKS